MRSSHAGRMTAACSAAPVQNPTRLLAIAVLGVAVDDAADGDAVVVDADWLDIADVEPSLLAQFGVQVGDR